MLALISAADFPKLDSCWLRAPSENLPGFLEAFVDVSLAVQIALRQHVPAAYFENPERFRDPKTAYPMLVYQASPAFRGKIRTDLTYDVLDPAMLASLARMAKANLIELLAKVEGRLRAEGRPEFADSYRPKLIVEILQSVQRISKSRRSLCLLIRGEGALVDALIQLGGLGALPVREQAKRSAMVRKKWSVQLRRLYQGKDFTVLAPVLLDAATQALQSALTMRSGSQPDDPGDVEDWLG